MTDAVVISLIGALGSVTTVALGIINNIVAGRHGVQLTEAQQSITTLQHNTDGITDRLVKITGQVAYAKGIQEGVQHPEEHPGSGLPK
jgi:hypothetical protein